VKRGRRKLTHREGGMITSRRPVVREIPPPQKVERNRGRGEHSLCPDA